MELFRNQRVKKRGVLLAEPVDDDERCRSCDAACCRGFPRVELTRAEYELLRGRGAVRLQFLLNGHYYLEIENGCEFLVGNRCGSYDLRPAICRRFTCRDI